VLSQENFLGTPWFGCIYPDLAENARKMHAYFAPKTDVRYVIYLRPQPQWAESAYRQALRLQRSVDPEQFAYDLLSSRYLRFTHVVEDLAEAVGSENLMVRPYTSGMNVVGDFLAVLGIQSKQKITQQMDENSSNGPAQSVILKHINAVYTDDAYNGKTFFFRHVVGSESQSGVKHSSFPDALQTEFANLAMDDWQNLAEVVDKTCQGQPEAFRDIAANLSTLQASPYIGNDFSSPKVQEEIVRELHMALAQFWRIERSWWPTWPMGRRAATTAVRNPRALAQSVTYRLRRTWPRAHRWIGR